MPHLAVGLSVRYEKSCLELNSLTVCSVVLGEPQHEWTDEHEPLYPSKATPNVEKQFLKKLHKSLFSSLVENTLYQFTSDTMMNYPVD